ncbi:MULTISPECIES: GreA/GreB family elongation factor [Pseudomonas]|uniref:GreA/GreB family elongation factor n=1 Tax=Pseudomonas TaxID=286 RepID=UPI000B513E2C|nr:MULTISPECIES: GreA/GreB family elongation factor [Pseudomonas]MBA1209322.1 transcription elongation factor GreAB [Pseudomonas fulva]MBA1218804.1 transcription elongation factor GreAB [Pseudomonas fulva]MDH0574069.1 GreA/GreB family elongation factor [Pseudomonas fulva]RRW63626.1 transcription elongation factor GreAB [Pseudomonas fulva]TFA87477.1 GreA/GreB family transcription elongation factor [Pseudomonas sp. URIL14HWK12:I1]
MNKTHLIAQIIAALEHDLDVVTRAAQSAYEAATAEENIAENKYDTLGLEASYLATGQARRSAEIRQALQTYRQLKLRDYDPEQGVQVSQVVILEDEQGQCRRLIIGPEAAGLKIGLGDEVVMVITPRSPLGQQLMGKRIDEEVSLNATGWTLVEVI